MTDLVFPMPEVLAAFGVTLVGERTQQIKCPVHGEDRSPSARYYADEGRIHCFRCGKGWDAIGVVSAKLKLDRDGAAHWLRMRFPDAQAAPLPEQVRGRLKPPTTMLGLNSRLDALEPMIGAILRVDPELAVNFWYALDFLRLKITEGELTIAPATMSVDRLTERVRLSTPS